jgi:hypothetical protein
MTVRRQLTVKLSELTFVPVSSKTVNVYTPATGGVANLAQKLLTLIFLHWFNLAFRIPESKGTLLLVI